MAQLIRVNRGDKDESDHDLLPERVDVHDVQAVAQAGDDQGSDQGAPDVAEPALQAGAAQDHRGYRIEGVLAAGGGLAMKVDITQTK